MRHDYSAIMTSSMIIFFAFLVLSFPGAEVAHVCLQTSNLASFTVEIATKFLSLMSKMIEMKSHVVI